MDEAASNPATIEVRLRANGGAVSAQVEPRLLLSDFIRHQLGLTGTHVGCEHGVCGACTILLDGEPVRSCLMLAVQAEGHEIRTVESLAGGNEVADLDGLQAAFRETHALQCGFCTPGILMSLQGFIESNPEPTEEQIREALTGNLCRCTGYQHIVDAVALVARRARGRDDG